MTEFPVWFKPDNFNRWLLPLRGQDVQCLQLGVYTGDASQWIYDNLLSHSDESFLVDVDTWAGSNEVAHNNIDFKKVERHYDKRRVDWGPTVFKRKMSSLDFLDDYRGVYNWDFVYVDADHRALQTLANGVGAFIDLKVGGIIAFDDYLWTENEGSWWDPKLGIDAFTTLLQEYVEPLYVAEQVWLRKTADPLKRRNRGA